MDPLSCLNGVFVLPDSHHGPTTLQKLVVRQLVSINIAFEFGGPEFRVPLRVGGVLRAAVPKATVDEYGELRPRERNIDRSPKIWLDSESGSIPKSSGMKLSANQEFRAGVASLVGLHGSPNRIGGGQRQRRRHVATIGLCGIDSYVYTRFKEISGPNSRASGVTRYAAVETPSGSESW